MLLKKYGWTNQLENEFNNIEKNDCVAARVICCYGEIYSLLCDDGELQGRLSGKFLYNSVSKTDYPAVGDWVVITKNETTGTIHSILTRKSIISRQSARAVRSDKTEEQIIASNIDTIFIVSGLDRDFNIRRLERYFTLAMESGANPVIVLNKADICDDLSTKIAEVEGIAFGMPIIAVSALKSSGLEPLDQYLIEGKTIAFIGSSGVGKSSLINSLLGEDKQDTGGVREMDGRGKHTTTRRELILMPQNCLLMDTPGMKELQLWSDEDSLNSVFDDVYSLTLECKFSNCAHKSEPGCAIKKAMEDGKLTAERYKNYQKIQRELARLNRSQDKKQQALAKKEFMRKMRIAYVEAKK